MKRFAIPVLIALLLSASFSCRKDFSTLSSTGNLTFSKDTVFLDTIFTNISSSTYAVKVYNKSSDDIHIPAINLGRSPSFYRLNVDGVPGTSFENVPLRADDSLYIFIEATIDYTKISEPIYKDSIVFDSGETLQDIKLITQVVDSHFLYPRDNFRGMLDSTYVKDIRGDSLRERKLSSEELHFKNDKPYVIYGYCTVPENETLTIDAGAKIYFHKKSALVVKKNASIRIEGTADQKVHFEGDRLEPGFSEVAGQWDALWLQAGSKNNLIEHALIKNAGIGIRCDSISSNGTPTLELKNTEIYNSSEQGLLALGSHVRAENVVIGNSQKSFGCPLQRRDLQFQPLYLGQLLVGKFPKRCHRSNQQHCIQSRQRGQAHRNNSKPQRSDLFKLHHRRKQCKRIVSRQKRNRSFCLQI